MSCEVEKLTDLKRKLTIRLPASDIEPQITSKLKSLAPKVNIKGFRPGKVPFPYVQKHFYEGARGEVIEKLIGKTFEAEVKKADFKIAGTPKWDVAKNEANIDLECIAEFEVYPNLGNIQGLDSLEITLPKVTITDTEIDEETNKLRKQLGTFTTVEAAAKDGDKLRVDIEAVVEGADAANENDKSQNLWVEIGSKRLTEGLEEALVGCKAGDKKSIPIEHPDDHQNKAFAGKTVTFNVKVHEVQAVTPANDNALYEQLKLEDKTAEALKSRLRDSMQQQLDNHLKQEKRHQVRKTLLDNNPFDVPQALIDNEINAMRERVASQMGIALDKIDASTLFADSHFEKDAKDNVRFSLILKHFIDTNDIKADEEALRKKIDGYASMFNQSSDFLAKSPQLMNMLSNNARAELVEEQAFDKLFEKSQISEKQLSFIEAMQFSQAKKD